MDDNHQPDVDRVCWANGRIRAGYWGRARWSNPRQDSTEDCAWSCRLEGSACTAFAYDPEEDRCAYSRSGLVIDGIEIDTQGIWSLSLMWNDLDCFECFDCEEAHPDDNWSTAESVATIAPARVVK